MPTYVLPQVLVFQDFRIVPAVVANPLRAHISGPHAYLLRYSDVDEREKGRIGFYDRLVATGYVWPDRPAGGIVDTSYVKLWMQDALLRYFSDTVSQGSTITKVAGYNNRVKSNTVRFASNGEDYPRHSSLLDRDVQLGDVALVRGLDEDSNSINLWTYVKNIIGEEIAAEVGTASVDADNPGTQSASSTVEQVSGAVNCVTLTPDETDYNGLLTGDIQETYDIVVMQSSVGGDFTTAILRVISGSGNDDVEEVVPQAAGAATEIGNRGLLVTFDKDSSSACSDSAVADDVSADDLIAGQRWQVSLNQAFTKPVITGGGTFDSINDTTYIIEVTRGGKFISDVLPQISVSTTNGIDLGYPLSVTGTGTAFDVGTLGVTVTFTANGADGLRKGDRYYIECTGEKEGAMTTIELGNNMSLDIPDGSEVDLTLFIRKPLLQIEQNREGFAPVTNWDTSETEITVNDGIIAYDETWTDNGVPQPLDVYSEEEKDYGILFVEYRAWRQELIDEVNTIRDTADIDDIIGPLHPDNPLKWGVFKALENSNGSEVKYTAVGNPDDVDSWVNVLEQIVGREDVYGLVPLTRNRTVLDLFAAHALDQSAPEQGLWRVLWTSLQGIAEIPIVSTGGVVPGHLEATTSDDEVALAKIEDDPLTSGTQYTILRCTSENADFVTNGVLPGDIVRTLYVGDGFGNYTYSEFVVDEVQSEEQIRLLTGPDAPVNVASKFEIWRNLSATQESAEIALDAGSWGSRRVRAVWPDILETSGTLQEGYFLCCALAGLRSGILPHQGMTRLEIVGFTDVPRTLNKFNRSQLDAMAVAGTWIVTQDRQTGKIFTRHAVTTGNYDDINQREEMLTSNVDSISYRFKQYFEPYIGVTNVTPSMQHRLELEVAKLIRTLQTEAFTEELGGQLIDATIVSLAPHTILRDRYVLVLNAIVPYALNNFEIHLVI
jgi:hypothetical protein